MKFQWFRLRFSHWKLFRRRPRPLSLSQPMRMKSFNIFSLDLKDIKIPADKMIKFHFHFHSHNANMQSISMILMFTTSKGTFVEWKYTTFSMTSSRRHTHTQNSAISNNKISQNHVHSHPSSTAQQWNVIHSLRSRTAKKEKSSLHHLLHRLKSAP